MILTSSPPNPTPSWTPTPYLPTRPSPLSPRSLNWQSSANHINSSSINNNGILMSPPPSASKPTTTPPNTRTAQPYSSSPLTPPNTNQHLPYSQRPIKPTPLFFRSSNNSHSQGPSPSNNTPSAARESRRQLFLHKVRHAREDARFARQSDSLLKMDWCRERRGWEERMRRLAPPPPAGLEEEEEDVGQGGMEGVPRGKEEEEVLDELERMERRELEELVGLVEEQGHGQEQPMSEMAEYGSDEEEYDRLFAEVHGDLDLDADAEMMDVS